MIMIFRGLFVLMVISDKYCHSILGTTETTCRRDYLGGAILFISSNFVGIIKRYFNKTLLYVKFQLTK